MSRAPGAGATGSATPQAQRRTAAHFQALVESSEDAIFSKDDRAVITSWNPAAERLYGYTAEEAVGQLVSIIVPEDHANEEFEILNRILAGERIDHYETERVRKDGSRLSISLTVSPIREADGTIAGASVVARDISERVARDRRAARLQEITTALARESDPNRAIGVLVRDGVEALGADAATLGLVDEAGERVVLAEQVGHTREGLAEWQSFPVDADVPMCVAIREMKSTWDSTAEEVRGRYPVLADAQFEFAGLAVLPLVVEGGALGAVSFSFREPRVFGPDEKAFAASIVQQVAYALERARIHDSEQGARRRLSFLARASEVLSESLDVERTLQSLADLVVRHMSDWCAIDLAEPYAGVEEMIVSHVDRSKVELAQEVRRRYPTDPDASTGVPNVIRTGRSELHERIPEELLRSAARDQDHLELIRKIGLVSAMVVPLAARGRTLGAISFVSSDEERLFGPDDLELAEDLARRAALAIDTSMLFEREHETALTLQRALLPGSLPEVDGIEVAARYLPAEAGLEVGGDWYDVIDAGDGRIAAVIGDVAGRGVHAAAVMGRLAMSLRAYLVDGRPPEEAVAGLDELMREFDPPQMSTLFAFSLDLSDGTARYVRAGHPPALLRDADGNVVELEGEVSPPVGLIRGARFVANATTLAPGSTLLLYTDGLIERRRVDFQVGLDRLKKVFADGAADPAVLVESIPRELDAERVPDDIALLALHVPGS